MILGMLLRILPPPKATQMMRGTRLPLLYQTKIIPLLLQLKEAPAPEEPWLQLQRKLCSNTRWPMSHLIMNDIYDQEYDNLEPSVSSAGMFS